MTANRAHPVVRFRDPCKPSDRTATPGRERCSTARRWWRGYLRCLNQDGASSIEFLAVLPFFLLMAMVVLQFAVVGFAVLNTQAAARDGVRVAAVTLDSGRARTAAYESFGAGNELYSLDEVLVDVGGGQAQVTVESSIRPLLIPRQFLANVPAVPFRWSVTAPIYDDTF